MKIEIWSDVVCPWCYIGKRRLEAALEGFDEAVDITWRSFELDPNTPKELGTPVADVLARKYGMSPERVAQMTEHVRQMGEAEGIAFAFDRARSGNTFDAHRLIHHAQGRGKGDAMKERLMQAYFTEGELVSDHDTLVRLAEEVGLEPGAARAALVDDATAQAVRSDEGAARVMGVSGVPFFVFEGKYGVSGAQPTEVFSQVLAQVVAERAPGELGAGALCDDEGCEVPSEA
jgi:predicted DsbA family dithiol-disulfide isomerase